MRLPIERDYEYNEEEVIRLVKESIGNSSIKDYSLKAGIGTTILSRIINGSNKSLPVPLTLIKIARASNGRVDPNLLLRAAGYTPEKYRDVGDETSEDRYINSCMHLITQNYNTSLRYWETINYGKGEFYNISGYTRANQNFFKGNLDKDSARLYFRICFEEGHVKQPLLRRIRDIYGGLAIVPLFENISKYTIITSNEDLYRLLCDNPPYHINLLISVVLTNPEGTMHIEERYLDSAYSIYSKGINEFADREPLYKQLIDF